MEGGRKKVYVCKLSVLVKEGGGASLNVCVCVCVCDMSLHT